MHKQGTIVRFDVARGFGFIRSPMTARHVFFHVRDFRHPAGTPPVEGLDVVFDEIEVGGRGPRGMAVQPAGLGERAAPPAAADHAARPRSTPRRAAAPAPRRHAGPVLLLMAAWLALLVWAVATRRMPASTLPVLAVINALAVFVAWRDRVVAARPRSDRLHVVSALGGWPLAWWAALVWRQPAATPAFWSAVALHAVLLLGWLFWAVPQRLLP